MSVSPVICPHLTNGTADGLKKIDLGLKKIEDSQSCADGLKKIEDSRSCIDGLKKIDLGLMKIEDDLTVGILGFVMKSWFGESVVL